MPSERLNKTRALVYHERPVDSGFVSVTIGRRLPSSSGEDAALSRRKHEFDSRRERQTQHAENNTN